MTASRADPKPETKRPALRADRIVPPSGATAWLVGFGAAAMAFLAVLALALAGAAVRLGAAWELELARTATLSLPGDLPALEAATEAALRVLETTPGVRTARLVPEEEMRALLAPWVGRDLPETGVPLPRMIAVESRDLDVAGLRLRLSAEVPQARLDDHDLWRAPLAAAQTRLRVTAIAGMALIFATLAAITGLAARASVAANAQVIEVLRLVGARDRWIARGFVRRITLRALGGGTAGTLAACAVLAVFPDTGAAGLPGLRPTGAAWAVAALVPAFAALVAFAATHLTVLRMLKGPLS